MLQHVFERLQPAQVVRIHIEAVSLDSTGVRVNPDDTGAQKTARKALASPAADGLPRFIWLPQMLDAPSPLPSHRAKRTTPPKDAS
jgi:hypothetical protein